MANHSDYQSYLDIKLSNTVVNKQKQKFKVLHYTAFSVFSQDLSSRYLHLSGINKQACCESRNENALYAISSRNQP